MCCAESMTRSRPQNKRNETERFKRATSVAAKGVSVRNGAAQRDQMLQKSTEYSQIRCGNAQPLLNLLKSWQYDMSSIKLPEQHNSINLCQVPTDKPSTQAY